MWRGLTLNIRPFLTEKDSKSLILIILKSLLIICLLIYPLFLRLDFTKSNFAYFDIIMMINNYAWIYLTITCLILSLIIVIQGKVTIFEVLIVSFLMVGLYVISQYPTIITGDVITHGFSTKEVILEHTTDTKISDYPGWWPGSSIIYASLVEIAGLDLFDSNIILTIFSLVVSSLFLYLIAIKTLGRRWGGLGAILYFVAYAYSFRYAGRDHFSPQTVGFMGYLMLMYFWLFHIARKEGSGTNGSKKRVIITYIITVLIVISHGYSSFCAVLFILGFIIFNHFIKLYDVRVNYLSAVLIFISWWIFKARETFNLGISSLSYLFEPELTKIHRVLLSPLSSEFFNLPKIGLLLRDYYWKPLLLVILITSIFTAWKYRLDRKVHFLTCVLFGSSIAMLISLLTPIESGIQFSIMMSFFLIPVSYMALFGFFRMKRNYLVSLVIVMLIVPSFFTMFTIHSEYLSSLNNWEISGFQFITTKSSDSSVLLGEPWDIYKQRYFEEDQSHDYLWINGRWENISKGDFPVPATYSNNDFIVINSFKSRSAGSIWVSLEKRSEILRESSELMAFYDNGKFQLFYAREGTFQE